MRRILRKHSSRLEELKLRALANPWDGRGVPDSRHRLVAPGELDRKIGISLLLTFDEGHHGSGWFRNSDYERCWHASMCCVAHHDGALSYLDTHDDTLRAWCHAIFREHLKLAWIEPPASPFDTYRTSQASRYVTHVRLFTDLVGRPIKPEGEVYHLKPWPDGTSPEKVFR